jgi:hypothetical protein
VLDKQQYDPLIEQLMVGNYTRNLEPIEHIIKKNPFYAYSYARDVIKERWVEAEDIIKTDSFSAYWYTYYVMKERWIEAEPNIKKGIYWWARYVEIFGI